MDTPVKMTVRLPPVLHGRLKRRAQASNRSLNQVIVEALQEGLAREEPLYQTREDQVWRLLRESGLWEPLGPEWQDEIADAPDITHEELREMLKGVPPLSDIIIEERGPLS